MARLFVSGSSLTELGMENSDGKNRQIYQKNGTNEEKNRSF